MHDPSRVLPPPEVLDAFGLPPSAELRPVVDGHINVSWLAIAPRRQLLLQRINHDVFRRPEQVQENIVRITDWLRRACLDEGVADIERAVLRVAPTRDDGALARDGSGWCWRAFHYIPGSRTELEVATAIQAESAAAAFGRFQRRLGGFPVDRLHETIPRFHDTPWRFAGLAAAAEDDALGRRAGCGEEIDGFEAHASSASILLELSDHGATQRPVHNDAKLSNVLLDSTTGAALCVIDLDTVMPGSPLFDFGEMVRSMAHRSAEDETDLDRVVVEPELYGAIARGYLAEMGELLHERERPLLFDAARLLVLENGVRFLTDHLRGDLYFRVSRPGQNLDRARAHLALLTSLDAREDLLRELPRGASIPVAAT